MKCGDSHFTSEVLGGAMPPMIYLSIYRGIYIYIYTYKISVLVYGSESLEYQTLRKMNEKLNIYQCTEVSKFRAT